ncbi:YggS family pyridoxal phosphate-dependent enzyme [Peribacillus sp. SCS-155]|uniref:YggS family pyridoxal phosphate-dependent enzyme n=1 Tax=Peribacillus sedimenti TaxID=3115297 RepID=UPI00390654FB
MKVSEKLTAIKEKISEACERSGRNPEDITIVAVTKYVTTDRAREAVDAGILHLGENRDEGLLEKYSFLGDKPVWHFIGSLQTRKVKNIIDKVTYIHSLDRIALAEEIQKRARETVQCFVQVNVSGEASKHGLEPGETLQFIRSIEGLDKIKIVGLMAMAPFSDNEEILRNCFRTLKTLQTEIQQAGMGHAPCNELSMGMSNDYPVAIEEGATIIRIGTALVGEDS